MFACEIGWELFYPFQMFDGKLYGLRVMGLLAGCAVRLCAGDFAAPAEGPVAFRRDQVPLDVTAMNALSRGFSVVAEEAATKTAFDRRGVAQMLALAVALDPANTKARSLIDDFTSGQQVSIGGLDAGKIEGYRVGIWQSIEWLDTLEAGSQGQALAAYLKDLVILFDPKNPRAQAFRDAGERGAWAGWVPPIAAYETKGIATTQQILPVESAPTMPSLTTASLATLVANEDTNSDKERWVLKNTSIQMSVVKEDPADVSQNPFALVIGPPEAKSATAGLNTQILQLLQKQHGKLPLGFKVTLDWEGLDEAMLSKDPESNSATLAVLASAAVTGRELGNVMVIGKVDAAGEFSLPVDFWTQLQSLGPGGDRRLVLPLAAAEYLLSMLALERQPFFMEYEVLLASNFEELLNLTAKTPDAALAKASEQFREIRKKGASQPLGQYVANLFVRRRLAEIVQETPYHYSAKMLAVQGAGNRPTIIGRIVLMAELRLAIEPMEWIVGDSVYEFEPEQIGQFGSIYESCRVRVDRLVRHADKGDRELVSKAQVMVGGIRVLDRAAKTRGDSYDVLKVMDEAQKNLIHTHTAVIEELDHESGGK